MNKKRNDEKNIIEKNNKKIIVVALVLILIIGGTYAWLTTTVKGTKKVEIEAGTLKLTLDEGNEINAADTVPMTDIEGLKTAAYTFTLKNTGTITSEYTIYIDDDTIDDTKQRLDDDALKYSLKKNDEDQTMALLSTLKVDGERVLESGRIEPQKTNTYELRLWIKEDATTNDVQVKKDDESVVGRVFAGKLRIEASQIKE